MRIPVVGPTYKLSDRTFDTQRCVNLIPELSESGTSKHVARLINSPGKELWVTAGGGPIRGEITTAGGRCFFVSGRTLYEISTLGVATDRGTLNTSIGRVSIAENGTQVMLVDGTNGYIFTLSTNTLAQIADAQFPNGATVCAFMDTYFLANNPGTGDFYISDNNDGTSWAAADKTTVESAPDNLVGLLPDHGELVLGGTDTMEVYVNTGRASFPFERQSGAVMDVGLAAAHTLKSFDNNVVWLGRDKKGGKFVYTLSEATRPVRISTKAVEEAIATITDVSDAYAYVYKSEGHEYYVLQVPGLNSTWVYDAATKLWHERMYYNASLNREERDRASCHTFFNGISLVGDRESGNIYKLRDDFYTDNGDEIHRIRITPHLHDEMQRIFLPTIYLDIETGVGLTSGQGSDPQVILQISRDGGRTYGDERWRSFGKKGEYKKRTFWTRNGSGYDIVLMFKITDPVRVSINGCYGR